MECAKGVSYSTRKVWAERLAAAVVSTHFRGEGIKEVVVAATTATEEGGSYNNPTVVVKNNREV